MNDRNRAAHGARLLAVALLLGCGQAKQEPPAGGGAPGDGTGGSTIAGGGAAANAGTGVGATDPGTTGGAGRGSGGRGGGTGTGEGGSGVGADGGVAGGVDCEGSEVIVEKRLQRLTFGQISVALHGLLGDDFGTATDVKYEIGPERPYDNFLPYSSPREGAVITAFLAQSNDQIALDAGAYVLANLETVMGCGAAPSESCAWEFVTGFAEAAFRRPVEADELASLGQVFDEVKALTGSSGEAAASAISAVLEWPQFLYRTEFGEAPNEAGPLTPYELASELSFALGDAPPDGELLTAAAKGRLTTPDEISAQIERLLETPAVRQNLESAMSAYFRFRDLETVVIDDAAFTIDVRNSQMREGQLFLANTLWSGPLGGLLTSRRSWVNRTLADVYGFTLPAGVKDPNEFVEVELPANRGGLLTLPVFLTPRSRPDDVSLVGRALEISRMMECLTLPPGPTAISQDDISPGISQGSQRAQAELRLTTTVCADCHKQLDAFGLALDTFDHIGRYRTQDLQGRPVQSDAVLPPPFGSQPVADAVEMQQVIAASPVFARCMAKNFMTRMLEQPSVSLASCALEPIVDTWDPSESTLADLVREIGISPAFRERKAE